MLLRRHYRNRKQRQTEETVSYSKMTLLELKKEANKKEIDFKSNIKKDELIQKLEEE